MPRKKRSDKYYLVIDTARKHVHGAFEFTKEGKEQAVEYSRKMNASSKETYKVIEK